MGMVFNSYDELIMLFPFFYTFQLKSDQELDYIKGFKLEALMLKNNPFCKEFRDHAELVR